MVRITEEVWPQRSLSRSRGTVEAPASPAEIPSEGYECSPSLTPCVLLRRIQITSPAGETIHFHLNGSLVLTQIMRLIEIKGFGELSLTKNFTEDIPRYAILSHTWGDDDDEVTFADFIAGAGLSKAGYRKIEFCRKQAVKDGLRYFWVDTCCIDKSNPAELSEAINSMFHWYRDAVKCYVYLIDVSTCGPGAGESIPRSVWGLEFRQSRWFTRAWTLQELIAPATVEFFSREGQRLGDKRSEEASLEQITGIPVEVFRGKSIAEYTVNQWMIWATERRAKRKEDEAYCLLGIFNVHMSLKYGEGRAKAFARLQSKIQKHSQNRFSGKNRNNSKKGTHSRT